MAKFTDDEDLIAEDRDRVEAERLAAEPQEEEDDDEQEDL